MKRLKDPRVGVGREGEALAEACLIGKGYRLLDRRFLHRGGEIDLVMADGRTIVFVEVRRRRSACGGDPLESVGVRKRRSLIRSARIYLAHHRLHDRPCRFDVVAVRDRVDENPPDLQHLLDAFRADGPV